MSSKRQNKKQAKQELAVTPRESGQGPGSSVPPDETFFGPQRRRSRKKLATLVIATAAALISILAHQVIFSPLRVGLFTHQPVNQPETPQISNPFAKVFVAAEGSAGPGDDDECFDSQDPLCYNYEWFDYGNKEISLTLERFLNDYSGNENYYVMDDDLFPFSHICDVMWNFDLFLPWLYECVYDVTESNWGQNADVAHLNYPWDCATQGANCYANSENKELWDPCIQYYDDRVCARCKFGLVRLFSEFGVYCGRTTPTVYPDMSCTIASAAYDLAGVKYPIIDGFVLHSGFYNSTTGIKENICLSIKEVDDIVGCEVTNPFAGDFNDGDAQGWFDGLEGTAKELATTTGGCFQCQEGSDFAPTIEFQSSSGIYNLYCNELDQSIEPYENLSCGAGAIYQWEGVIESVKELVCKECGTLIPNCVMCDSAQNCNLCKSGYLRASIKDSQGVENIVCLPSFCGFYGQGSGCSDNVKIEGCDKSKIMTQGRDSIESCDRCSPGYYEVKQYDAPYDTFADQANDIYVQLCYPVTDKAKKIHFLQTFDSTTIDIGDDFYPGTTDYGARASNPTYTLQGILQQYQGEAAFYSSIRGAYEAIVEIYLFKGTHHFITCIFDEGFDYWEVFTNELTKDAYSWICGTEQYQAHTYDNYAFVPTTDNIKFYIRALDCDYLNNIFSTEEEEEKDAIRENCVDVSKGEKAELRIASPHAYFNITNFARFENIEFTGEDLFASATYLGHQMDFGGQQGVLSFMPFTKCSIEADPKKLDTLDHLIVKTENALAIDDFVYQCSDPFSREENLPPYEFDDRCFTPEYFVSPNSMSCGGDPTQADFWEYNVKNKFFTKRHKTLFNLYSFSPLSTKNVKPPALELVGCTFKFFVNQHDSLINVETDNLGIMGIETDFPQITYYGDDRSARISIENSNFYSNAFCKGLIYYNRFQEITFSEAPKLLNLTANFKGNNDVQYDELGESYIRIHNSEFVNTGFQQVINALQLDDSNIHWTLEIADLIEVPFRKFQDQGLIINTNGFDGTIEVLDSHFDKNIAYIKEVLLYESQETQEFLDFDDKEMLIDFTDDYYQYLQLKVCVDNVWSSRYFLYEVIHPDEEWDDNLAVDALEHVAPFVIKGNQGPIIFNNNVFEENIGTIGGVLHIEDPDFRFALEYDKNPYIVLKDNQFLNNMAYWAGNAFHITMTMRMVYGADIENDIRSDAWQTCGAGILIDNNYFEGNIGLKKHNGGAGVIRCRHTTSKTEGRFEYLSGKQRDYKILDVTDRLGNVIEHRIDEMDDPSTTTVKITNLYGSPEAEYELLKYGTKIVNNTFTNNYTGKRGSALLVELVSEVQILDNVFKYNGPVHAHREMANSPYIKHFLRNNRTLAYYVLDTSQGYCYDEAAWLHACYRSGYQIDMPQIQGAVYVKNCYSLATCWASQEENLQINEIKTYEAYKRDLKPWQRLEVSENLFYDNHANIVMFEKQNQAQASSLYIFGGTENIIHNNEFSNHRNWADAYMMNEAWDIYRFYPDYYFRYSQATIMRVEYPYSVYADTITESVLLDDKAIDTELSGNTIIDNLNMQVLTYASKHYKASLLEFDCEVSRATLKISDNEISRNQFIGESTTFFFINGGIVEVTNNEISYNGKLSAEVSSNSVEKLDKQYTRSQFPWDDYSFELSQDKGIFTFEFETNEMPSFKSHTFTNNRFSHIYCQTGCAYYVTGSLIQQFSFSNNVYNVMVSGTGAAVFHGEVALQPSNELAQVWIQSYRDETFDRIWGGSISLTGNNVPATIIKNATFINNFGETGAAISFNKGGALYISDSQFRTDYNDDEVRQALQYDSGLSLVEIQPYIEILYGQLMNDIQWLYKERLPQKFLFSKDIFNKQIKNIRNSSGLIYLKQSFKTILNDQQPVFAYDNAKLFDVIFDEFSFEVLQTEQSAIKDSLFKNSAGNIASCILLESSKIKLIGTKDTPNFVNNVTPAGSTIFATFSYIEANNMLFEANVSYQGGVFQLDSTTILYDSNSVYRQNKATQGGVVFAINDSQFVFTNSQFIKNNGNDGSVLYGMYNSYTRALSFINCRLIENTSSQNLMQLMSSKAYVQSSEFENNWARFVNHGITMITSEIEFYDSTVSFTDGFVDDLDLSKLDCGFFSLFLSSKITIGKNSEIRNLVALNQAVLSAFSLSSVYVTEDVRFLNNRANSLAGMTISLQNTDVVVINDAYFSGNPQTNVQIELGKLEINNSTFTEAQGVIVYGIDSVVNIKDVYMHDSQSRSNGHGFYCTRCFHVSVDDSTFQNLGSDQGGAIYIESLFNETTLPVSYVRNSRFIGNQASRGGAMVLDRPNLFEVSANEFLNNSATDNNQGDGGAILYKCNPTVIDYNCTVSVIGNEFNSNLAVRKGGALRYENTNFTDKILTDFGIAAQARRSLNTATNQFFSNVAEQGSDLASYPWEIRYIVPPNDSGARIIMEDKTILLAAGQDFQLILQIIDKEGRLFEDENKAIAKISFVPGQDLGSQALMLGSDAVAEGGEFKFNSFKVRIKPKTSAQVQISFQGITSFGTPIEFLDTNPVFTVKARECVEGEQYTEDLSCKPCAAQFFLYVAQTSPGFCKDCHPHAYCYGMNNTAPKPGYWRSLPTLESYTPCFRPESCLGGNETDPLGQCEEGYQGILCGDCMPGYSRAGLECSICPNVFWNVVIFVALLIILIVGIMLLVKATLGGVEMRKPLYNVYLKIFLNHFQILAAVASIDFKWPPLIQSILQSQQGIADGPSRILSIDCIMMDLFPNSKSSIRLNYIRLIMFTSLPFLIQLFSTIFWAIYGRCKRIHAKERGDKATATAIIVLFLFYPTIVQIIAKSLNCFNIEDEARLYDDLEERCYEGQHLLIILVVSLPGLIAWAAGIPIYALIKLFRNVGHLEKIKKFTEGKQHEDLLRSFRVRLGFLTAGYDDKYFYWEIVLLMRKTVLVLMIVFLSSVSPGVQSLTSILVLTIFFMIQWRLQPYYDPGLNNMETLSLFVIILTIYFGLYYQAGQGDEFMESSIVTWLIFLAVLIPSLIFAVNFSKIMWIEILKVVAGKSAKAFRYATCGTWDLQQFKAVHMNYDDDNDKSDQEEDEKKKVAPKEEHLVGFQIKEEGYSSALKNKIIERRKKIKEQRRLENLENSIDNADKGVADTPSPDKIDHMKILQPVKKKRANKMELALVNVVKKNTNNEDSKFSDGSVDLSDIESSNLDSQSQNSSHFSSARKSSGRKGSSSRKGPAFKQMNIDMKKHKYGQTFNYKDEIMFPGEAPDGDIKKRDSDDFDDVFDRERLADGSYSGVKTMLNREQSSSAVDLKQATGEKDFEAQETSAKDKILQKPRLLFSNKKRMQKMADVSDTLMDKRAPFDDDDDGIVDDYDIDESSKAKIERDAALSMFSGKSRKSAVSNKSQPMKKSEGMGQDGSDEDPDFMSDEEGGRAVATIRGNTERNKTPTRAEEKQQPAQFNGQPMFKEAPKPKRDAPIPKVRVNNGNDPRAALKEAPKPQRDAPIPMVRVNKGKNPREKSADVPKSSGGTQQQDQKSEGKSISDFKSDEEGGRIVGTIRGNTQRTKKTDRSEIGNDAIESDEEGGGKVGVPSIRGNTQRKISEQKPERENDEGRENIFYRLNQLEQEENKTSSSNAEAQGPEDQEAADQDADKKDAQRNKRKKRSRKKKNGAAASEIVSQQLNSNRGGPSPANKQQQSKLALQIKAMEEKEKRRQGKRDDEDSSDDEYLF